MCGSKRVHSGGMNHAIDGARKRDKKEGEIKVKNKKKIDEKKKCYDIFCDFRARRQWRNSVM